MSKSRMLFGIVLLAILSLAADADACQRCGLFGRLCRGSSHHVAAVAVADVGYIPPAPVPSTQTFTFINNGLGSLPLSEQGQTVYGNANPYGFQDASRAYANDDALIISQLSRALEGARGIHADVVNGLNVSLQTRLAGSAEIAKIYAAGQANEAVIRAAGNSSGAGSVQSFSLKLEAGKPPVIEPLGGASVQAFGVVGGLDTGLADVVRSKCISCHSGGKIGGGLDLSNLSAVPSAMFDKPDGILDRLTTGDPGKLMPKGGKRLGPVELSPFFARGAQLRGK